MNKIRLVSTLGLALATCIFSPRRAAADTTNYYWRDAQGNGRWDWGSSQWYVDGGGSVGVPRSDGGAVLYFQGNGSTTTYINSNFNGGYFNLNSVLLDSGSSGRNYIINTENGGSGIQFYGSISTLASSGSLTINCVTQLGGDASINASGGAITLGQVNQNGKTLSISGSANISTGDLVNSPGTGSVQKSGSGTLTLGGSADNTNVALSVSGGSVYLNKASSSSNHAVGSGLTISGGTLILGGSGGDQIYDSSPVALSGGTFNTAGLSERVGALTLTNTSSVDLGAGASTLIFGGTSTRTTGTLAFSNWTDGSDHIFFYSDSTGTTAYTLDNSFLSNITINGFGVNELATGEIVPVPEPATWLAGFLLFGTGAYGLRRRLRSAA